MIPFYTKNGSGVSSCFKFSYQVTGFLLITFFCLSSITSIAQETESAPGIITVCPYGDFDGHHHTPPANWILQKLESPSQSLIGDDPCSTIVVTYNDFPPAAEAAFQAAVDIWETVLSSPIIIRVEANWTVLGENTLGSAGPANLYRNFANAPTTDFYAAALADQISGVDQNPGGFDITANFNSDFDWYFGTDGNTPFNQVDLVSIVLHELGHGLGFVSSKQYIGGLGFLEIGISGFPLNYDNYLTLGAFGSPLLDFSGIPLGNAITSNNVYNNSPLAVAALGGVAPRIYAPVAYADGSTLSHWDESTYPSGNINSLMTPSLGYGEAIHNPGDITIGLFEDMGWTICYAADYCPDLEASIGDACDDGDPSSIGDTVNADCECVGISSITNDAICSATPINCGAVIEGSTIGATDSGIGYACTSYSYPDVFYSFTGYPGAEYSITVNGDNYDGMLSAYSGACDGVLTSLGCADSGFFPGIAETITFSVSSTQTVYIQTSGYIVAAAFTLELSCSNPYDTPCNASTITADGSILLSSNVGATADEGEVIPPAGSEGCNSQDGWCSFELSLASSVWFTFVAPPSGSVSVSTCNDGTSIDTQLALYGTTDCSDYSTFSLIGANDDLSDCAQTYASSLTACVNPGETYYIQVDGYGSDRGAIAISVTEVDNTECIAECLNTIPYITASLIETNILQTLTTCVYEEEYITLNNALNGNEYEFTSNGTGGGYMTVRSGSFDGPVLGAGFSPLSILSAIDGSLFIHFTVNENCETATGICVISTAQCTSCPPPFDCPSLEANIGDPCDDGNPETGNDVINADCECLGEIIFDCPLLEANIGDGCDDGNPATENDVVTADCDCAGTVPAPANDLCANAQNLDVNLSGDCAGNETVGTTSGATSAGFANGCEPANPEVFYSFNSGEHSSIQFNFESITVTDLVFTLLEGGCDGAITECGFATSNIYGVSPFTYYTVRISTNTGAGNTGTFSICLEGVFDCPLLSANIGDACDDGNPETENDVVTADCNCEGTIVYDCPDLSANIGDACDDGNTGTENDVISADCECVGTIVYDCPALEANIGDTCDDGNPLTVNDVVRTDCSCLGFPVNDACADAISLVVNLPEDCAGNETVGTTTGATASNPDACESPSPDVYYSFNSGSYTEVIINLASISASDLVLSVFEGSCGSTAFLCLINPATPTLINVIPSTTYYVRVHSLEDSDTGSFNICLEGVAAEYASLTGSISGWNNNCLERDVEVSLSELTLGNFYTTVVTLSPDGTFNLTGLEIIPGTYDILVTVDGALARLTEDIEINSGVNSFVSDAVILGDLNASNSINVSDLSLVGVAFGSVSGDTNFNLLADLNCNGVVNVTDISLLGASFGLQGDVIIIVD